MARQVWNYLSKYNPFFLSVPAPFPLSLRLSQLPFHPSSPHEIGFNLLLFHYIIQNTLWDKFVWTQVTALIYQ